MSDCVLLKFSKIKFKLEPRTVIMAFSQIIRPGKLRASFASSSALFVISSTFISITTCLDFDDDMKYYPYPYNNYNTRYTPGDLANPSGNSDTSFFTVMFVIVVILAVVVIICGGIYDSCCDCSHHLLSSRNGITRPVQPNTDRDNWIRATPAIFTIPRPSAPPAAPSTTCENDVAPAYESPPAYNECVINMELQKR